MSALPVLLVHSSSGHYGADRQLALIATGIDTSRFEPLVVLAQDGPLAHQLTAAGVEVLTRELAVLRREHLTAPGVAALARARAADGRELAALARARGAALVHSNSSVLLGAALAARRARVAHVWHVREIYDAYPWLWPARRAALRRSGRIVCVSQATAERFGRRARVDVVLDGLPELESADRDRARAELGLGAEDFACVLLGRLTEWKGQDVLLRALAHPALAAAGAVAVIAGDAWPGQEQRARRLHALAAALGLGDRARFVGFHADPAPLYAAADVVVVPSTRPDPLPNAALEAAAQGCCVVASDDGGLREIFRNDETGVLTPPGDHAALARALAELAADPQRRGRLGAGARADVGERFGSAGMLAALQAIWAAEIERRAPPAGD